MNAEDIPAGSMDLTPGMNINASGQMIGKLDEVVRDSKSGTITFLQMREGHLWGKKDVAIPVTDVDFTDGDTIYLSISKDAVGALPAVSTKSI